MPEPDRSRTRLGEGSVGKPTDAVAGAISYFRSLSRLPLPGLPPRDHRDPAAPPHVLRRPSEPRGRSRTRQERDPDGGRLSTPTPLRRRRAAQPPLPPAAPRPSALSHRSPGRSHGAPPVHLSAASIGHLCRPPCSVSHRRALRDHPDGPVLAAVTDLGTFPGHFHANSQSRLGESSAIVT